MTPLWIAIVFLALGLALLAARVLALRDGEDEGGLALEGVGAARDPLTVHAAARRESGRRKMPSPFTRPSDLFPPKAPAPAPRKAPAAPTPSLEELLARCPEIGSEEDAPRSSSASDSSEEMAAALPPEPELTPEQRERIARLMSAVKAEFGSILADEKKRAKDAETEGP